MQDITDLKTVPVVGEEIEAWMTGRSTATVTAVRPYEGAARDWFTHFVTYTSPYTESGVIETPVRIR